MTNGILFVVGAVAGVVAVCAFLMALAETAGIPRRLGERRFYRTVALLTSLFGAQIQRDPTEVGTHYGHPDFAAWDVGDVRFALVLQWDRSVELRVLVSYREPFLPDVGLRMLDGIASWPLNRVYMDENKLIARIGRLLEEKQNG